MDFSGGVISSSQRPLPDNTQHSQQTHIHARPRWDSNPQSQPQTHSSDRTATLTGSSLDTAPFTTKHSPCYTCSKHILRWSEFWIFVYFRCCVSEITFLLRYDVTSLDTVSEIAFLLRYDVTSLDTVLQMFWDRLMVCSRRQTTVQWRSVTSQKNGTFCVFVCTRRIAVFSR
jgi:hypothetical protein